MAGSTCDRHVPPLARTLRRKTNARCRTAVKLLLRHILMRKHVLKVLGHGHVFEVWILIASGSENHNPDSNTWFRSRPAPIIRE